MKDGLKVKMIIAEAALELVPHEIVGHPSVLKNAAKRRKRPAETLLDVSLHYHAMTRLRDRQKRGRPDILHLTLLELLSSPLNIEGTLELYIHTYGDYGIEINPRTKIPRNYIRFVGLMEQLLSYGRVPKNSVKPLMTARPATFEDVLRGTGSKSCILLSEDGEITSPEKICSEALVSGDPLVIGGFPHGDFREDVKALSRKTYAVYHRPLDAWVVASRLAYACEKKLKILL